MQEEKTLFYGLDFPEPPFRARLVGPVHEFSCDLDTLMVQLLYRKVHGDSSAFFGRGRTGHDRSGREWIVVGHGLILLRKRAIQATFVFSDITRGKTTNGIR